MAAIDTVKVNITAATQAVAQDSFAIPLILGTTAATGWGTDVVRSYTAPASMLADGFTASAPEYLAALSMFANDRTPSQFFVGRRSSGKASDDLAAISAVATTWYQLVLAGLPDADVTSLAPLIEGMGKMMFADSATVAIKGTGTTDLGSVLQKAGYDRTVLSFTTQNQNGTQSSGWVGSEGPATPGSNDWALKPLRGVTAETLTDTERNNLFGSPINGIFGKCVNAYYNQGGVNVTFPGVASSGKFVDITVGIDWLKSSIKTALFQTLANTPKIPYTNAGVALLRAQVERVLREGARNGLLVDDDTAFPLTCTAPLVADVAPNERALRRSPPLAFNVKLKGAILTVKVEGSVNI